MFFPLCLGKLRLCWAWIVQEGTFISMLLLAYLNSTFLNQAVVADIFILYINLFLLFVNWSVVITSIDWFINILIEEINVIYQILIFFPSQRINTVAHLHFAKTWQSLDFSKFLLIVLCNFSYMKSIIIRYIYIIFKFIH
jgi:hypothetical protein